MATSTTSRGSLASIHLDSSRTKYQGRKSSALAENLERLRDARNLKGRPFTIKTLPMPAPVVFEGQRLPASYANFYIANDLVSCQPSTIPTIASP
jgi:agmatine/peptidylarginine deiminase